MAVMVAVLMVVAALWLPVVDALAVLVASVAVADALAVAVTVVGAVATAAAADTAAVAVAVAAAVVALVGIADVATVVLPTTFFKAKSLNSLSSSLSIRRTISSIVSSPAMFSAGS